MNFLEEIFFFFLYYVVVIYYYEMDCLLFCLILVLVVGWWECWLFRIVDIKNGDNFNVLVMCCLFVLFSLIDRVVEELLEYVFKFLEVFCELLGFYLFRWLDMLVLLKCFVCMGFKRLVYI